VQADMAAREPAGAGLIFPACAAKCIGIAQI
jgi:hypothetical protein